MDRLVCGDVGFGKTEVAVRAVFKAVQDGRQAAVLAPTTLLASQHAQTFADRYAPYPVRVELLSRFLSPAQQRAVVAGPGRRERRRGHRDPPAAGAGRAVQAAGPPGGRRGAALRGDAQGGGQAHGRRRRRADAHRQPDPAHPRDGADGHPRPVDGEHAAGRPPADPDLRRRAGPSRGERGAAARAAAGGPGLLRAQPGVGHRPGGARHPRPRPRGQGGDRPRADGRGKPRDGGARLLGAALRRARVHDHHRVGDRHAVGQHADRRPRRPPRPGPAAPDPRPGRPGRPAGLRLPVPPGRPRPVRAGLRAAAHDRRAHRARLRLQDRHARPRDPGGREPAGLGPVGPHRGRGLRPLRPAGGRGGGGGQGRGQARAADRVHRRAGRRAPAQGLRGGRGRAARGVPPARRGVHRGRRGRHRRPSGSTATARCPTRPRACSRWPGCAPARWRAASARSR